MSDPVRVLLEHLPKDDNEYDSYDLHKNIFTHVQKNVLPTVVSSATAYPPLPVIIYAIQNILTLQPPSLGLLPSLLQLLVHLEIVRTHIIRKLCDVLHRHEHHASQNDPSVRLLADPDRKALEDLTKPSRIAAQRKVYRKIIDSCCLLHILHLWRTYDVETHGPFATYLIDYFPTFFERDPDTRAECAAALKERPWHHDITADELDDNWHVGSQAAEFMVKAAQHAADHGKEHQFAADPSLDDVCPAPDLDRIAAAVQRFIDMVQSAHDALQLILNGRL